MTQDRLARRVLEIDALPDPSDRIASYKTLAAAMVKDSEGMKNDAPATTPGKSVRSETLVPDARDAKRMPPSDGQGRTRVIQRRFNRLLSPTKNERPAGGLKELDPRLRSPGSDSSSFGGSEDPLGDVGSDTASDTDESAAGHAGPTPSRVLRPGRGPRRAPADDDEGRATADDPSTSHASGSAADVDSPAKSDASIANAPGEPGHMDETALSLVGSGFSLSGIARLFQSSALEVLYRLLNADPHWRPAGLAPRVAPPSDEDIECARRVRHRYGAVAAAQATIDEHPQLDGLVAAVARREDLHARNLRFSKGLLLKLKARVLDVVIDRGGAQDGYLGLTPELLLQAASPDSPRCREARVYLLAFVLVFTGGRKECTRTPHDTPSIIGQRAEGFVTPEGERAPLVTKHVFGGDRPPGTARLAWVEHDLLLRAGGVEALVLALNAAVRALRDLRLDKTQRLHLETDTREYILDAVCPVGERLALVMPEGEPSQQGVSIVRAIWAVDQATTAARRAEFNASHKMSRRAIIYNAIFMHMSNRAVPLDPLTFLLHLDAHDVFEMALRDADMRVRPIYRSSSAAPDASSTSRDAPRDDAARVAAEVKAFIKEIKEEAPRRDEDYDADNANEMKRELKSVTEALSSLAGNPDVAALRAEVASLRGALASPDDRKRKAT
ncbi:hypothetical protein JL720_355 [Aureococcus anophagefferens]|nr:hypothetical protein JL720_355 [Aureococcus anophagefferens]